MTLLENYAKEKEKLDYLMFKIRNDIQTQMDSRIYEWFIDNLSAYLGVQVVFGDADCMENFKKIGQAFTTAFFQAGRCNPDKHVELMKMLMAFMGEALEELKLWAEGDENKKCCCKNKQQ